MRFRENRLFASVSSIETTGYRTSQLKVRKLVLAYWNDRGFAEQYVSRLMNGICIHGGVNLLLTRCPDFLFHCRISTEFGIGHESEKRKKKLVEFRHVTVGKDECSAVLRVEAGSHVIHDKLMDAVRYVIRTFPIRKHLIVRNHDKDGDAHSLETNPILKGTEQVADV